MGKKYSTKSVMKKAEKESIGVSSLLCFHSSQSQMWLAGYPELTGLRKHQPGHPTESIQSQLGHEGGTLSCRDSHPRLNQGPRSQAPKKQKKK